MSKEEGATQKGVPTRGLEQPTGRTLKQSDRELEMERIFGARLDNYEAESGAKVDRTAVEKIAVDDDTDPDDVVANEARKQLEEAANKEPAEEPVKEEEQLDSDDQLVKQAEGDEMILDAATLAKAKVRVKVEGVEELVPASKVLGQYQKNSAADVRLADATRMRSEAEAALKQAQEAALQRADTAATRTDKAQAQQDVRTTQDAVEVFKKASAALFEGDADEASRLFAEAVATANAGATGRSNAIPVDADQVAEQVEQRLSHRRALDELYRDYPELKADEDLRDITNKRVNLYVAQGKSIAEAIKEAGEYVGDKFKLGKAAKQQGRPMRTAAPTTRAEKQAGKSDLDEVNASNVRSGSQEEPDDTPASIIAQIRAGRPGLAI